MVACPACRKEIAEAARFCPYCGTAAQGASAGDPWIGRTVDGKFRVEALVGQGGMGRVYRARHLTLDRTVVLKMLHRQYSADPQIAARFQREARAASRLNHPNSIAVLDFGAAEDGTLFMAMEHLGGRDLAQVIAREFPLGEERIVRIGAQILSALAEAHARGVVHRDLKPENVMVESRRDAPDFVKVLDFGIAKITSSGASEPRLTEAGLVAGTPEYMSPEQARGAELDARSDLYSVGVVLYQMATGDLPFHSETPVGFLTKHLAEAPVPPRARRPDLGISPALDALVSRALEKDPARRFQSADEMRTALLACAPAAPHARSQTVALPETAKPARRWRPVFWVFVAAMGVAAAGGGAIVLLAQRAARERAAVATPTAPAAPAAATTPPQTTTQTTTRTPTSTASSTPAAPAPGGDAAVPAPAPLPASSPASPTRRDVHRAARLFRRAEDRRAAQDVDGAIRLYLQAEEADPGLAEVQKKLGLCYQLKGDARRARERYRRYLATGPPDADRVRAILAALE